MIPSNRSTSGLVTESLYVNCCITAEYTMYSGWFRKLFTERTPDESNARRRFDELCSYLYSSQPMSDLDSSQHCLTMTDARP